MSSNPVLYNYAFKVMSKNASSLKSWFIFRDFKSWFSLLLVIAHNSLFDEHLFFQGKV